jgi:hypothetical protein
MWGAGMSPDAVKSAGDYISELTGLTPTQLAHDPRIKGHEA